MSHTIRIGALLSGSGTNLQAIIDSCNSGKINGSVVFVGSDNVNAPGLDRGKKIGIPTFVVDYESIIRRYKDSPDELIIPNDFDLDDILSKQNFFPEGADMDRAKAFFITRAIAEAKVLDKMRPYPFDLLVLAGFMRNLTPYFIDRVNRDPDNPCIMNIHPSLLPAFPGVDGYGDTFRYGCKIGGCTVHFVDYGEDTGPIIGQNAYEITEEDTLESIKAKGLNLEWELYSECVRLFAQGRLRTVKMSYTLKGGQKILRTVVKVLPSQKE
ncbi:MAG: phosphoribosylglycinamide formyltransferase [Desulfobacterales bacterium]|nr:MAG: phosphoribosylglycinamide formyltransferase [Desulfobacterales bacterium]